MWNHPQILSGKRISRCNRRFPQILNLMYRKSTAKRAKGNWIGELFHIFCPHIFFKRNLAVSGAQKRGTSSVFIVNFLSGTHRAKTAPGLRAFQARTAGHFHMCQGLNSLYFHMIGDGHQPNSRGL